jgi:hypothetical protein
MPLAAVWMKATFHHAVLPAAIPERLPPLFRPLIDAKRLGASPVTLTVFPASAVVISAGTARRRLACVRHPCRKHGRSMAEAWQKHGRSVAEAWLKL